MKQKAEGAISGVATVFTDPPPVIKVAVPEVTNKIPKKEATIEPLITSKATSVKEADIAVRRYLRPIRPIKSLVLLVLTFVAFAYPIL